MNQLRILQTRILRHTVAALVLLAPPAAAGQSAGAAGTAAARVVAPLSLSREADLDFGTIAVSSEGSGSVTVTPLDARVSYTGSAAAVCAAACTPPHAAQFVVSGEPGRSYRVAVPNSLAITSLDLEAGVLVDGLVVKAASNPSDSGGVLSTTGVDRFEVGATLHLPAQAPPGHYTAQVPVIVSYP